MIYRFTIDGSVVTEANNIQGWDKFVTNIKRGSNDVRGLIQSQEATLTFIGTTYNYFYDKFFNETICQDVEILIEETFDEGINWEEFYTGKIFIKDLEFNDDVKECKSKIQDNSFYARINNNKSIKTTVMGERSKNGVTIIPPIRWEIQMFDPANGAPDDVIQAYHVYDVLRYMVQFMSDDEVDLQADIFNVGGKYEGMFITVGLMIRTGGDITTNTFELNWKDLFDDLYKSFNIYFDIQVIAGKPTIVIDEWSAFYEDTNVFTFTNPSGVIIKAKTNENYAKVKLGSEITSDGVGLLFPEGINLTGFRSEEYFLLGQCNIDTTLDLVRKFVISSNVIEDALIFGNDQYDDDIFFIYCNTLDEGLLTANAEASNHITSNANRYYNETLFSSEALLRFYGAIPNSIIKYLGNTDNTFYANTIADVSATINGTVTFINFSYPNDTVLPGRDPGGNYGNPEYTAPLGGVYSFAVLQHLYVSGLTANQNIQVDLHIIREDFGATIIQDIFQSLTISANGFYDFLFSGTLFLNSTDVVYVSMVIDFTALPVQSPPLRIFKILTGSYFTCTNVINYGGTFQEFDPNNFKTVTFGFEYPLSRNEIKTIRANSKGKFMLQYLDRTFTGWIDEVSINHESGIMKTILISSISDATN